MKREPNIQSNNPKTAEGQAVRAATHAHFDRLLQAAKDSGKLIVVHVK